MSSNSNRAANLQALTRQSGWSDAPFFSEDHPLTDDSRYVAVLPSTGDYGATMLAATVELDDALAVLQQYADPLDTDRRAVGVCDLDADPAESFSVAKPVVQFVGDRESVHTYC